VVYRAIFEKMIIVENDVFQIYSCDQIAFMFVIKCIFVLYLQCMICFTLGFSMLGKYDGNDVAHIVVPFQVWHKLYYFHFFLFFPQKKKKNNNIECQKSQKFNQGDHICIHN